MSTSTAGPVVDGQLISAHPATGSEIGRFPVADTDVVHTAVALARETQAWWSGLDFAERKRLLLACKAEMTRCGKELVTLLRNETGKSVSDALTEISTCFEHLAWAPRNAKRVLGRHRKRASLTLIDHAGYVEYQPYGVVAVIGPWN
ncbi:MAG: aldehyde dehydrogenase family protein, partial [Stackebrandtia sp.]